MVRLGPYDRNTIVCGHVLDVLRELPDECVHMAVTSPPYWGLRDYGTKPQVWGGHECEHAWGEEMPNISQTGGLSDMQLGNVGSYHGGGKNAFCSLCGAWKGSLGLEPSPDLYVQHIVEIFREVRRVLRGDGTLWLNLGASYAGSWGNYAPGGIKGEQRPQTKSGERWQRQAYSDTKFLPPTANVQNFKPKDLVPIPWMVAMALQADGWWLRSSIIWAKGISFCPTYSGSCMPESVRDRPTQSYEYVFLLSKAARYYYDQEAVREPSVGTYDPEFVPNRRDWRTAGWPTEANGKATKTGNPVQATNPQAPMGGRNLRSVWAINPHPWRQAHFATYPPALIEPMILAGTSAKGVCPECGNPWERVVKRTNILYRWAKGSRFDRGKTAQHQLGRTQKGERYTNQMIGWQPTCSCGHTETIPAIVLDPFMGSGTTALVALEHGRQFLGIELNPEYIEMANRRIAEVQPKLL